MIMSGSKFTVRTLYGAYLYFNIDNQGKIKEQISEALNKGADVIVLACTHYHWIEKDVIKLTGDKAEVLQPETAIIEQLKRVLERLA